MNLKKQLLTNKKIVLVVMILLLALIVGIVILVTQKTDEVDKDSEIPKLEILEPDEVVPEDSTNASGSWDDLPDSSTQSGDVSQTDDKTQNANADKKEDEKAEDGESEQEEPKKDELEKEDSEKTDPVKKEEVHKDDVIWGEFY